MDVPDTCKRFSDRIALLKNKLDKLGGNELSRQSTGFIGSAKHTNRSATLLTWIDEGSVRDAAVVNVSFFASR